MKIQPVDFFHHVHKYYLAGRWDERDELRLERNRLTKFGFACTARWLDKPEVRTEFDHIDECAHRVEMRQDLADINEADALILDALHWRSDYPTAGRWVEWGYALGRGKVMVLIGDNDRQLFTRAADLHFVNWARFQMWLHGK